MNFIESPSKFNLGRPKRAKMRRTWLCAGAALWLALCLGTSAWSYTLEVEYLSNSNLADAYARKTDAGGVVEFIPGEVTGQGTVSQTATTGEAPAVATGGGTTRQAVVLTDHVDCTQGIMNTVATAGHTDSATYEGYGQGYGNSTFRFKIVAGPGEPTKVWVTIGFRVSGSINLGLAESSNKLMLQFAGKLRNFISGNDLQIAAEQKTWQNSLISTTYSNGRETKVLLDTNKFYTFEGFVQVDAEAYGYNFSTENHINFDAFVCIKDIRPGAVPFGALFLLLD
jgi:hypothetical protein